MTLLEEVETLIKDGAFVTIVVSSTDGCADVICEYESRDPITYFIGEVYFDKIYFKPIIKKYGKMFDYIVE